MRTYSRPCRHCGHPHIEHIHGRLCDHAGCRCLIFKEPAVRYDGRDHCSCGHIRDNHLSSGTGLCLLGGCYCTHFEYPEMCVCGHARWHHDHDSFCDLCTVRSRFYCAAFRSTTPGDAPERCSPAPFKITETTGDKTMDDLTYSQNETLRDAFDWMLGEMRTSTSNGKLTWAKLAGLTASEIVSRYATRQRSIVAELTALSTMLAEPVSSTVDSLNSNWGRRVRDDLRTAQNTLANAEYLLEMLAPVTVATVPEPEPAPAPEKTFVVTVTDTTPAPEA